MEVKGNVFKSLKMRELRHRPKEFGNTKFRCKPQVLFEAQNVFVSGCV